MKKPEPSAANRSAAEIDEVKQTTEGSPKGSEANQSGVSDAIYQRFISVLSAVQGLNFDHGIH